MLAHEDLYVNRGVNDDKDMLTNVDRPFPFSAFSCHANAFGAMREARDNQGPSLGEDMVMLPDRGAVASWASTGFEVLTDLAERGFPVPRLTLEYREIAKLKGTYVDALPALADERGRVHTSFRQTVAATGRLSSSDPSHHTTRSGRVVRATSSTQRSAGVMKGSF